MSVEDPFFTVKSDVEVALQNILALYDNWRRLLSTVNTSTNQEFQWTAAQLQDQLKNVEYDLGDLEETIAIVEQNPHKFKLDTDEIKRRKTFITSSRAKVNEVVADLNSPLTKGKFEKDKRDALLRSGTIQNPRDLRQAQFDKQMETENQRFLDENSTQLLVARQDQHLDEVSKTVNILKTQAITIGNELDDQDILLNEVEEGVDSLGGRMKSAMNKLQDVYKKSNEKTSLWMMAGLIVIVVILVILLLSI